MFIPVLPKKFLEVFCGQKPKNFGRGVVAALACQAAETAVARLWKPDLTALVEPHIEPRRPTKREPAVLIEQRASEAQIKDNPCRATEPCFLRDPLDIRKRSVLEANAIPVRFERVAGLMERRGIQIDTEKSCLRPACRKEGCGMPAISNGRVNQDSRGPRKRTDDLGSEYRNMSQIRGPIGCPVRVRWP